MRKVFWENPYQTKLSTTVWSMTDNRILFKETIAFSFSGGQESDKAYVNGLPIVSSEIEGNLIYYILPDGHGLRPGDTVLMEIDWTRRLRLMRLHFAAELILELISHKLGIEKIGAHIAENKARIDFRYHANISVIFEELLGDYQEIIAANKSITTNFDDSVNQRRYWEIEGLAKVPCGGTHVKSTKEVGDINLKRVNIGSGKERVEITLVKA